MEPFIGEIVMFGGNFAPRGWAFCEGQLLAISQNQALFSILGTTYGGDGRTTFALPDLRGRVPISPGTGPGLPTYRLGARSGQATHTLTQLEMPSHTHTQAPASTVIGAVQIASNTEPATTNEAAGAVLGAATSNVYNNEAAEAGENLAGVSATFAPNIQMLNTGGNQAHNNMQPYLAVYYIIALQGTFPSRS